MRVIAGTARRLQLKSLKGTKTRPTLDRYKETLFNTIQGYVPGARFLDIFAGTGSIGIEALSRGADSCLFIENDREAIKVINENLKITHLEDRAEVMTSDALNGLVMIEKKGPFDVIFMDPPYDRNMERRVLEYLTMSQMIDEDSLIIFEASLDTDISYLDDLGYDLVKEKHYKSNKHVFVQRRPRT